MASLLAYAPAGGRIEHREAGSVWCAARGVTASSRSRARVRRRATGATRDPLRALRTGRHRAHRGARRILDFSPPHGCCAFASSGVAVDRDGLIPDALVHACKTHRPKVLLATPTLAESDGIRDADWPASPREQRDQRDRGIVLLEDDVYGPLVPDAPRPLSSLVPELSYYVSSFSKAVTPALRTAFVVAPNAGLATRLSPHLQATGWLAPPIMTEIACALDHDRRRGDDRRGPASRGAGAASAAARDLRPAAQRGLSARAASLAGAPASVGAGGGFRRCASAARCARHERRCVRGGRVPAVPCGACEPRSRPESRRAFERARHDRVGASSRIPSRAGRCASD